MKSRDKSEIMFLQTKLLIIRKQKIQQLTQMNKLSAANKSTRTQHYLGVSIESDTQTLRDFEEFLLNLRGSDMSVVLQRLRDEEQDILKDIDVEKTKGVGKK